MVNDSGLRVRRGGSGAPVLLLLHGLGANAEVWRGVHALLRREWPGSWIAPDLPGHGGSAPLPRYSFGHLAAAVAQAVSADDATPTADPGGGPPDDRAGSVTSGGTDGGAGNGMVVLGHSLGGVVALTLASGWFGVRVDAACGLGMKVSWSDGELAAARGRAARPARRFDTRTDAAARFLAVAGLTGLCEPDDPAVAAGVVEHADGGWGLAFDQAAFGVGAPDLPGLLAAARAPVVLAAGANDPLCTAAELRALDPAASILAGLGHNAHVEAPEALAPILRQLAELATTGRRGPDTSTGRPDAG